MSQAEHELLIAALLEGQLDDEGQQHLKILMASDPTVRKLYLDHCQMVASLKWEEGSLNREFSPSPIPTITKPRFRWTWLATAAAILFCILTVYFTPKQATLPYRGAPVAKLTGASGIEFKYGIDGSPLKIGDALPIGAYHLESGLVELMFSNQSKLIIEAPAQFDLISPQRIDFHHGGLTANIPKSVTAFTVATPNADINDVGTEYGIYIDQLNIGEVHVFSGKVALQYKSNQDTSFLLNAGQASLVNANNTEPSGIDLDQERFIRRLEEPNTSYTELILKHKPVLYFPMQPSVDGITLNDQSGNHIHGELYGARGKPLWTVGRIGTCIRFDGPTKEGFVVVEDYPKTTNHTLSGVAWVYALSRPRWASIMKNWAPGKLHGQFHFGLLDYEGCLEVHIEDATGEEVFATDPKPLPLHTWLHVAFVADGKELRLYRNGVEVASTLYSTIHTNPDIKALAIGTKLNKTQNAPENDHSTNDWHGRLDELSLFNHALSPETIQQLYLAGLADLEIN